MIFPATLLPFLRVAITYLPTYLHTYLPTYLHTYIPTYLPTCLDPVANLDVGYMFLTGLD